MRLGVFALLTALWVTPSLARPPEGQNLQLIRLNDGIEIALPERPADAQQLEEFQKLTNAERRAFYAKRHLIIRRLVGGMNKPGMGTSIRWVKQRIIHLKNLALRRPVQASEQEKRAVIESAVTSLVDTMWKNSSDIARSNGVGMTFVGGLISNTTIPKIGYVWGRSISIDIGVDFQKQTGYLRVVYDKQSLSTPGLSFDVGAMADVLLHLTNADLDKGDRIEATHVKLPVIGCFRYGDGYKAWGGQIGYSVVEMIGTWLSLTGHHFMGSSAILGMRALGAATVYSTRLDRQVVRRYEVRSPHLVKIIAKSLGLSSLLDKNSVENCEETLAKAASE